MRPYQYHPHAPPNVEFFVDFLEDVDLTRFTGTALSSGTAAVLDTVPSGWARLAGVSATDNTGYQIQGSSAPWAFEAGKTYQYGCRARFSKTGTGSTTLRTCVQSDFLCGLAITDTTLITATSGNQTTYGVYFRKDDGAATIDICVNNNGTETKTAAVATLDDAVIYTFAITITMKTATVGTAEFFISTAGVLQKVGEITGTMPAEASAYLTPSAAFIAGDADATALVRYVEIDCIWASALRSA